MGILPPACGAQKGGQRPVEPENSTASARAARHTLSPAEARQRAEAAARSASGDFLPQLTPPLPAVWPPAAGSRTAVYFGYTAIALPTSSNKRQVSSPYLKIEVDLTGQAKPKISRMKSTPLPVGDPPLGAMTDADQKQVEARMQAAQTTLFRLITQAGVQSHKPSASDATAIEAGYRDWMHAEPAIADLLKRKHAAFFRWFSTAKH
jgi:hypothetical protein